jgi:hypothetical protein
MHLQKNVVLALPIFLLLAGLPACGSTGEGADGGQDSGFAPDAPEGSPPDVEVDVHEPDVHPTIQVPVNGYTPSGSGVNTQETFLNVTNVKEASFGKIFERAVDGEIFAQPLYVGGLTMPSDGKKHNVVFVATEHDSVYAFDADSPAESTPLWHVSVGTSTPLPSPYLDFQWAGGTAVCNQYTMNESGITATPVIDVATNTLYVVALDIDMTQTTPGGTCLDISGCPGTASTMTCNFPKVSIQLHALDLLTGKEKLGGPVDVEAKVSGSGAGSVSGTITFDPGLQLFRAGLLLQNGAIYFGAASYNDAGNYHGWLFAYDAATLKQSGVFCDTPNGTGGGIWQSGRGMIADPEGNLYVVTGQGSFTANTGGSDWGDTVLKMNADLSTVKDYFTQFLSDYEMNNLPNDWDDDLGSSGATFIPNTSLLLASGKMGTSYLLDTNNLGKWNPTSDHVVQKLRITWRSYKKSCDDGVPEAWIYGTPVSWAGADGTHVYVWADADYLREFLLDGNGNLKDSGDLCWCDPWVVDANGTLSVNVSDPNCASPHTEGMVAGGSLSAGGALAVSSYGKTAGTGILWATYSQSGDALHGPVPGVLAAFDASNVSDPIWISTANASRDGLGNWGKFSPPTVANGKVYVATLSNKLVVYGLLSP